MVTDHAQLCHLVVVTRPVAVATVKTIVIAAYLPYEITKKKFQGFVIWSSAENDTDRILWLVSNAIFVSCGLFNDLTAGEATIRTFVLR